MKKWSEWESTLRQVAVSGHIRDANGNVVADARIALVKHPAVLTPRLIGASHHAGQRWEKLSQRLDRTRSRSDGLYFFMDLPPGNYTLRAVDPATGQSAEGRTTIEKTTQQEIKYAVLDIRLPAGV